MTDQQLKLIRRREAGPVGSADRMLELVDMAAVLLDAGFAARSVAEALYLPIQGQVTREERLQQALLIARAWLEDALLMARKANADWHALLEPARWWEAGEIEREDMADFAMSFVGARGRWPRADDMRRRFGKAPGHRTISEYPPDPAWPELPGISR